MNFVTTRHSSNEFGSALAAPKFSDLFSYFSFLSFLQRREDKMFVMHTYANPTT